MTSSNSNTAGTTGTTDTAGTTDTTDTTDTAGTAGTTDTAGTANKDAHTHFETVPWWPVHIQMPPRHLVDDSDIDAQLFSYVANAPAKSNIHSIADLDDTWVQANFDELASLPALRSSIAQRLETDLDYEYANLKYRNCANALIEASGVSVNELEVEAAQDSVARRIEHSIRAMGISKAVYLENEGIDEQLFFERVREETKHDIALNKALDALVENAGINIREDELSSLLFCEDPEQYLEELRAANTVEQASKAAARVKAMREVVAQAQVALLPPLPPH